MAPRPQQHQQQQPPPPRYPGARYERLPTSAEGEESPAAPPFDGEGKAEKSGEADNPRGEHRRAGRGGVDQPRTRGADDEDGRERAYAEEQYQRSRRLRWLFGGIAVVLLVGAFCHSAKKHLPSHRYRGEFKPLFKPRPSDFNDQFSGPGVVLESFRFGAGPEEVRQALEIPSASETLLLSGDELGFDVWRDRGRPVTAEPPKPVGGAGEAAADQPPPFGGRPPANLLLRPEPARIPHHHDVGHPPPVCFGPLKYIWQGPETITVDVDEFKKFVVLVKSSYVGAHIGVVDDPQSAQEGKVVIKPRIYMAEAELNQVLEVSELANSSRNAMALKVSTPSWDESGNGRYNCIRVYMDVVFPPSKSDSPENDPPVLQLFGAGTVRGDIDHADAPPLGALVGWAVHGRVNVNSARVSRLAAFAARDGVVKARLVTGDGDVRACSVNGDVEAGLAPTGRSSRVVVKGVNSIIRLHVSDEFSGGFRADTINGVVEVSGEGVEFEERTLHSAAGSHGSGNQTVHVSTINGPVSLHFGPMHGKHREG